jgi:hypothetical protein
MRSAACWLTFALVGAGPTGVELAGQIREVATETLRSGYRRIRPDDARVMLFDGGSTPLAWPWPSARLSLAPRFPAWSRCAGAQPLSAGMPWVIEYPGGGTAFDYCSAVQHERFVGELAHYGQVVADQDVGDLGLVADVGEQVQHLGLDRHVQAGDRLVEDQDGGLCRERAGDRDPLPLTTRQRAGQGP